MTPTPTKGGQRGVKEVREGSDLLNDNYCRLLDLTPVVFAQRRHPRCPKLTRGSPAPCLDHLLSVPHDRIMIPKLCPAKWISLLMALSALLFHPGSPLGAQQIPADELPPSGTDT